MATEHRRPVKIAKEYPDTTAFNEDAEKVRSGETTGMYARYDYEALAADEQRFAEMIDVPDTVLFNSGMAAIHTAIEAEGLKHGDIVLCSEDVYGVTKFYVSSLTERGVRVQYFDPADVHALEIAINSTQPRLIIAETVSSTKEMKVVDLAQYAQLIDATNNRYNEDLSPRKVLDHFFEVQSGLSLASSETRAELLEKMKEFSTGNNPFVFRSVIKQLVSETGLSRKEAISFTFKAVKYTTRVSREKLSLILDNTLPSPVLANPIDTVRGSSVDITVVESGTKHYQYGKNEITAGIAYSNDPKKLARLKKLRVQFGTYLQPSSEAFIPEDITSAMQENVKRHAANALSLAALLESKGVTVFHPNLRSHAQSELAEQISPDGLVTLFYIEVPSRDTFMDAVKKIGGDAIGLGSSFGHEKTWLSNFDIGDKAIRISVGFQSEEDFKQVLRIFDAALDA